MKGLGIYKKTSYCACNIMFYILLYYNSLRKYIIHIPIIGINGIKIHNKLVGRSVPFAASLLKSRL